MTLEYQAITEIDARIRDAVKKLNELKVTGDCGYRIDGVMADLQEAMRWATALRDHLSPGRG